MDWEVLSTYTSEVEARVVESFLLAQGLEVQLLDTHMNAYRPASRALGLGMRLMVRARDVERAKNLLNETQRSTHLEVVGEESAPLRNPFEKWIVILLILAAAIAGVLIYSHR
jgi:hypothetical protein